MKFFLNSSIAACSLAVVAFAQQPPPPQPPGQPLVQVRGNEGAGSTIFGNACGGCHGKIESAPSPAMLKKLTPEKIYEALTTGDMRNQAKDLTDQQKRDIAEWVSGRSLGSGASGNVQAMSNRCANNPPVKDLNAPGWNGWSPDILNARFQSTKVAGLQPASVSRLVLKWAFGLPATTSAYGQPTIVDGRVFIASDSGLLSSVDSNHGSPHWHFPPHA